MKKFRAITIILVFVFLFSSITSNASAAGLYKQYFVGEYKIDVISPHTGWAGPWPETQNITHVNIHIYKKNSTGQFKEKANYHISSQTSGTQICYYIYESVKKKSWNNCKSGLSKSDAQSELQNTLIEDMKSVTNWEIVGTVVGVAALVIIVWAFWPFSAIALV